MNWLWLTVLGLLSGAAMGYLQSVQQAAEYRSVGRLRLSGGDDHAMLVRTGQEPRPQERMLQPASGPETRLTLYRCAAEIRSETVLLAALKQNAAVTRLPRFKGKPLQQVVAELQASTDLETQVLTVAGNSAVLLVAFTATDPHSAQVVVQALMDAFTEHCEGGRSKPAAERAGASEWASAGAALRQMELLEDQYIERLRQQFVELKTQHDAVKTEIAEQLDTLRHRMVSEAALVQHQQAMTVHHQQYEQALAGLRQEPSEGRRTEMAAERADCVQIRAASAGSSQSATVPSAMLTYAATGAVLGLLAAVSRHLAWRRRVQDAMRRWPQSH